MLQRPFNLLKDKLQVVYTKYYYTIIIQELKLKESKKGNNSPKRKWTNENTQMKNSNKILLIYGIDK